MAKKRIKRSEFSRALFEYDAVIIALSLVLYLTLLFGDIGGSDSSCSDICMWDLGPFITGWVIISLVVFFVEILFYIKLAKKAPKKVDKTMLLFFNIVSLFVIFLLCLIIFKGIGIALFLVGGLINVGIFLGTTAYFIKLNKK